MERSFRKILSSIFFLITITLFLFPPLFTASGSTRSPYDHLISDVAAKYDVPAKLIHSIIRAESSYNTEAVSKKGAVGLMQLMPETARHYGVMDRTDPQQNIEAGVKHIKNLMKSYNYQLELVLAAYNAGPEAVSKYRGIPPYPETKRYINKVLGLYGKRSVRSKPQIYKFYDKEGRLILTNDRSLYLQSMRNN